MGSVKSANCVGRMAQNNLRLPLRNTAKPRLAPEKRVLRAWIYKERARTWAIAREARTARRKAEAWSWGVGGLPLFTALTYGSYDHTVPPLSAPPPLVVANSVPLAVRSTSPYG